MDVRLHRGHALRPSEKWKGDEGTLTVYYPLVFPPAYTGEPPFLVEEGEKMRRPLPLPAGAEAVEDTHFEAAAPHSPGPLELARWRLGKLREAILP